MTGEVVVGIDLGATTCAVAAAGPDGAPRIVPGPGRAAVALGIERLLGRRHDDPEVVAWARGASGEVVEGPGGAAWVRARGRVVAPQVLAAARLAELRASAERALGAPVTGAAIAVPAWFDAARRQALADAAAIAGLAVRRLVTEPVAAVLGHGVHRAGDRRWAVCHLRGGAFDVAIGEAAGGLVEVLATAADARLEPACQAALARAGLHPVDLDEVLVVGGATATPEVRRRLAAALGREPAAPGDPDGVVARGAAIAAARPGGRAEVVIVDVTARGLAIGGEAVGRCDVVIPPGSVVPTREHRIVPTTRDRQRALTFTVWEGEAEDAADNRLLARHRVDELPEAPAGEVLIVVELTVDVDGLCRVTATELVSGERPPTQVVGPAGMSREAIAEAAALVAEWRSAP